MLGKINQRSVIYTEHRKIDKASITLYFGRKIKCLHIPYLIILMAVYISNVVHIILNGVYLYHWVQYLFELSSIF